MFSVFKNIFGILGLLALVGCATAGEQTRAVLQSPPNVPRQYAIRTVPFVKQEKNKCGPSSLAMSMQWAGKKVTTDDLGPEVLTKNKGGTLQMDLVSASRRHGLLAIPIEGMVSLLREVAAGHPVIVLENQGLSWWPKWHDSVVVGYDLDSQEIVMHSGGAAFKRWPMNYFERGWKLGDYWGLVVLPPTELSTTAGELDQMKGAVGLELAGFNSEAKMVYENILKRWPGSLRLIGLSNYAYKEHDYPTAIRLLREATRLHPDSPAAKHNLEVAENASEADHLR